MAASTTHQRAVIITGRSKPFRNPTRAFTLRLTPHPASPIITGPNDGPTLAYFSASYPSNSLGTGPPEGILDSPLCSRKLELVPPSTIASSGVIHEDDSRPPSALSQCPESLELELAAHLGSLHEPTSASTLSSPHSASFTGSASHMAQRHSSTRSLSTLPGAAGRSSTLRLSRKSRLAASNIASSDAVNETDSKSATPKPNDFISDWPHQETSIPNPSSPSRLRHQLSNLSRNSTSGSIRSHADSLKSTELQSSPIPPMSRKASITSLARSPARDQPDPKRRSTLSDWARGCIDKTPDPRPSPNTSSPLGFVRPPSRGHAKRIDESDGDVLKESERHWGGILPGPKPPTPVKSEDNLNTTRPTSAELWRCLEAGLVSQRRRHGRAAGEDLSYFSRDPRRSPEPSGVGVCLPGSGEVDRFADDIKRRFSFGRPSSESGHAETLSDSTSKFTKKHDCVSNLMPLHAGSGPRKEEDRGSSVTPDPPAPELPLLARPLESTREQAQPSNVSQVSPTPVISSILSPSEIIAILGERGCQNLSSRLSLQECSQYPIAAGGFGDIYSGRLHDGTKVAIKTMRPYDVDTPPGKYQKSASVCEGLAYLHENNIIHGDLKGANILVSGNGTPMLTDFGNASLGNPTVSFTETAHNNISLRWTAPEMFEQASSPSRAGDVYALGMTILEIITGRVPFSHLKDIIITRTVVDERKTPPRPEDQIPPRSTGGDFLWGVLMSCWAYEPGLRPSAAQVRDAMEAFSPEMLIPIEPES